MDSSILKFFTDLGISGVLGVVIYYLLNYIKAKDKMIQELLNVNQEQNLAIKDMNTLLKEISECQKECALYAKYGYWWTNTHQPTPEICKICDDYAQCCHPRKIILKKNGVLPQNPPVIPR